MKMKHLFPLLSAAIVLTFNLSARADDGYDGGDDGGTNSYCATNSCDINGCESMYAVVVLDATSNAPAGASGIAKIKSENNSGTTSTTIDVKTFALNPGDYDLVIGLATEGTNVVIGQFTVDTGNCGCGDGDCGGDGGDCGDWGSLLNYLLGQGGGDCNGGDQEDHYSGGDGNYGDGGDGGGQWIPCNWGGCTNWGSWTNWTDTNFCTTDVTNCPVVTRTSAELPAGIDPSDIADISVQDTNGNDILVGDVTNPAPATVINISATVRVMPGVAAPGATGTAQLKSTFAKRKWTHQFSLAASGLDAKAIYKQSVNGKVSGASKATKAGAVTIKKLPSHTPVLHSLRLLNSKGSEAASAHF